MAPALLPVAKSHNLPGIPATYHLRSTTYLQGVLDEGITCPEFQGPRNVPNTQHHGTTEGAGRAGEPLEDGRVGSVESQMASFKTVRTLR